MPLQTVNIGTLPNDGTGDGVRTAFGKVNSNDEYLEGLAQQGVDDAASAQATADAAIPATEKGAAGGVATLNAGRTLTVGERPRAGLWLPGTAGNNATAPYDAAFGITAAVDMRGQVAAADWTPATSRFIVSGPGSDWELYLRSTGVPATIVRNAAGTLILQQATAALPFPDGSPGWVRGTVIADNGAGNAEFKWFYSDDGASWTQLGTTVLPAVVAGGIRSVGSGAITVGARSGGVEPFLGAIFRAQVYDGIDGTLVADFNAESPPSRHGVHPSAFTDSVGNVWTINGTEWEYRDDLGNTLATASEAAASTPGVAGGVATLDASFVVEGVYPLLSGDVGGGAIAYYASEGELSTFTPGEALAFGTPFYLGHDATIVRAAVEVMTPGASGAVVRLGIGRLRRNLNNAIGAFDVVDFGTVDATTMGVKTITTSETLTAGWHFLIAAVQGGAATRPSLRSLTGAGRRNPVLYVRTVEGFGVAPIGMAAGSISGALPTTIGLPSAANSAPAVFVSFA